jgi:hypothetical protein
MTEQGGEPPAPTGDSSGPAAFTPTSPSASPPSPRSVTVTVPRFPSWLKLVGLALIPAVVVGAIVYAVFGGDSGSQTSNNGLAAAVVDGFLRLGGDDPSTPIQAFTATLPPGYPNDLPVYPGGSIIASFSLKSAQGVTYFVLYSSLDPVRKIMSFFSDKLDKDPWQVEGAQNSTSSTALHFSKPSNPDIDGSLSVNHSDLDPSTTIYLSINDSSSDAQRSAPQPKFTPSPSLPLPAGFDNSGVPIFKGAAASIVTDTLFQKDSGSTSFLVSFITRSAQGDVIDFYRSEFQKKGWTVTDSKPQSSSSFALGIDFTDGSSKNVQGTISADVFPSDRNFTKVDMQVHVNSKSRSN